MDKAAAFTPAALEAVKAFPVEPAELKLVLVSENVTFRVTDRRDGAAYVLRLHRPGYCSLEELNSERIWTRALAEAGIGVPMPIRARDGSNYVRVHLPATGEDRYVGMTRWIEGEMLGDLVDRIDDAAVIERLFGQLGTIVAKMHNQSSAWQPPSGFTRRVLDADGLMGNTPSWGPFWDHAALDANERRLFIDTRDRIHAALTRYGRRASTFSVIHADMQPQNVLVDGEHSTVIDFDDAAFGWHLYDLAVPLSHLQHSPHFEAIKRGLLGGYRAMRAISDAELALIPMFMLVRRLAVIGWLHQRPEYDASGFFEDFKNSAFRQCSAFEPLC
jgi:Ser/Thr protein kinase RdoA (MazF antagonist)